MMPKIYTNLWFTMSSKVPFKLLAFLFLYTLTVRFFFFFKNLTNINHRNHLSLSFDQFNNHKWTRERAWRFLLKNVKWNFIFKTNLNCFIWVHVVTDVSIKWKYRSSGRHCIFRIKNVNINDSNQRNLMESKIPLNQ